MTQIEETLSPQRPEGPALICFNGHIHTLDKARPLASALAAENGEIAYVGDSLEEARRAVAPGAEELDLKGRTVIPGLIDAHSHLLSEGLKLGRLDVAGLSKEAVLEKVRRTAAATPPGEWIVGQGWDQTHWPGEGWPSRHELDEAAPRNPVVLDRIDWHSLWANTQALTAACLDGRTPDPSGGEFLREADGSLSGIAVGEGMWPVWNAVPPESEAKKLQALMRAQKEALGFGLTSVVWVGVTMPDLEIIKKAYENGDLKIRIRALMLAHGRHDAQYYAAGGGPVHGLFGEKFSIAGVKIHADGSLGSRSAWLLQDYADRPGHRGGHSYSDAELLAVMEEARDHDMQVAIHAIGDAAVRQAVTAMAAVLQRRPCDHRWRIEHFQVAADNDLSAAMELGIIPSLQTVGLMADLDMAEERLGPEVAKRAYNWRDFFKRGGVVINGSDGPVESVNPFEGMYAAVTRQNLAGRPTGGWKPEHRLSRWEALASYTLWSAWSEFGEARKGSLTPGKLADFVVLDRDLMACPESEIKAVKALMTFLGGALVTEPRAL
ncbi:MAG: amidohydrolase [Candidatus Adiutrix sp.]|jgi:predicted amidohydrolase YtcJ|nr:amidohydrolase [Candidatus Adiutrix sp.]